MTESSHPVILYDGVCTVCDASVQFILARDVEGLFRFASLQSSAGSRLAGRAGIDVSQLDTLVLLVDGRGFVRSDAVLGIAKRLGPPWSAAYTLRFVPRPVRDLAYRLVSMNRTHCFGRRDTCRVPAPELRNRFLDI